MKETNTYKDESLIFSKIKKKTSVHNVIITKLESITI